MPPLAALPPLPPSAPAGAMPAVAVPVAEETAVFSAVLDMAASIEGPATPDAVVAVPPSVAPVPVPPPAPVLPASGKILPVALPPALPAPQTPAFARKAEFPTAPAASLATSAGSDAEPVGAEDGAPPSAEAGAATSVAPLAAAMAGLAVPVLPATHQPAPLPVPHVAAPAVARAAPPLADRPRPAPISLAITATPDADPAASGPVPVLILPESPRHTALQTSATAQPLLPDVVAAAALQTDMHATAQPAPAAQVASAPAPFDFAGLIDRIASAREALQPRVVAVEVPHAEFGTVRIRFRHEDNALAVNLSSADPGFRAAVAAALPPVQAAQPVAPDPRQADPSASAQRHDTATTAGQHGSAHQRAPQQQRGDAATGRRDSLFPADRDRSGSTPEATAQGGIYA